MMQFDVTTAKFQSAMSGFVEAYGNLSDGMASALETSEHFIKALEVALAGHTNPAQLQEVVDNASGQLDMNVGSARAHDSPKSICPYEAKKNNYLSRESSEVAIKFWMKSLLFNSTHGEAEHLCGDLLPRNVRV